jgi:hypothetical protein
MMPTQQRQGNRVTSKRNQIACNNGTSTKRSMEEQDERVCESEAKGHLRLVGCLPGWQVGLILNVTVACANCTYARDWMPPCRRCYLNRNADARMEQTEPRASSAQSKGQAAPRVSDRTEQRGPRLMFADPVRAG